MEPVSMEDEDKYSITNLQQCSYRLLQRTAKNMGLPSNIKKIYLIQLIYMKKYRSQKEVDDLVKQVRQERKQLTQLRKKAMRSKKHVQSTEISSTSNSESPPITNTPKRVGHILIQYSPEIKSPMKYSQKLSARSYPLVGSDRVLRSFNRVKKPTYLLNNTLLDLMTGSDTEENSESRVNIVKEEKLQKVNRTYVRKSANNWRNGGEIVPVPRTANVATSPLMKYKHQRRISGIYPLNQDDVKLPNVSVRRPDGTVSKLNAIIQRPLTQRNYNYDRQIENTNRSLLCIDDAERSHSSTNMAEIASSMEYRPSNTENTQNLDFNVSTMSDIAHNNGYQEPNISEANFSQSNLNFSNSYEETNVSHQYKENQSEEYAVYYHKKIRAEQVRSMRNREPAKCETECTLPKINEVFSKFNSVYCRDVTQPIYVQVDSEPEIAPNPPYIPDPRVQYQTTSTLEKMYNLKNVLINQPLLQIYTTSNTRTVYSTPVISTAKAQPSSTAVENFASSRDSQPYFSEDEIPRVQDFFRNFRCEDGNIHDATTVGLRRSSSSIEELNTQDLGANVTIPEMVEDALELISQDGDYMERMGMDVRMQCILCNWAGPLIILEYHIRKDHSADIIQCDSAEWCVTYTLGSLAARRLWLSQVLELCGTLYVLSAKYEDPDCFMAALSMLSYDPDTPKSGTMTIYNKVTGEPFTWEGPITQLPPSMPYDNDHNCFKLQLSRMDLLPNSANLQLLNRELVNRSPTKVVVGQPELDSIHISLSIKIFD